MFDCSKHSMTYRSMSHNTGKRWARLRHWRNDEEGKKAIVNVNQKAKGQIRSQTEQKRVANPEPLKWRSAYSSMTHFLFFLPSVFVSFLIALSVNFAFDSLFGDSCCRRRRMDEKTTTTTAMIERPRWFESTHLDYLRVIVSSSVVRSRRALLRQAEKRIEQKPTNWFRCTGEDWLSLFFSFHSWRVYLQSPIRKGNASAKRNCAFLLVTCSFRASRKKRKRTISCFRGHRSHIAETNENGNFSFLFNCVIPRWVAV